ncbi:MAG: tRNA uridine-5-carboxymethylaminomethyl(34) synthesis GTPase MnmE [Fimbriimonadaceae bacterium]|nr:tRNA uridine-5-carboxymethylaminomethyl(34) synthesis GTPase MnmE [Fimbriimonadaceae bacterium]
MSHFDTIVAPITGPSRGAVAIVRLSGDEAWRIGRVVFPSLPLEPESHRVVYGHYVHGDDGLALPFAEGHSYTGEESVELSLHGSPASVRLLIEACIAAGARLAEPGEFTIRAFMNGRIDLIQAEAVRDTVESLTDAQLQAANLLREGKLSRKVRTIRDLLLTSLATLEAHVDFEEEIGPLDRDQLTQAMTEAVNRLDRLLATARSGAILREGLRIAIVGRPNAGKSSLMNHLLGRDRAIVTAIPGTTRDTLEETVDLGGVPCVLIDTAGLRATNDEVESMGVERTVASVKSVHAVWFLYDGTQGWTREDQALLDGLEIEPERLLKIANKADLVETHGEGMWISALTGTGCQGLAEWVQDQAEITEVGDLVAINARHEPLLREARSALTQALDTLTHGGPDDLITVGLSAAIRHLGEITGETASEDMIDRIFHDFCIGK